MANIIRTLFGSRNDRMLRKYGKIVKRINQMEADYEKLSDQEVAQKTEEFKQRLRDGEALNHILPEAFATVREASKRTLGMRHYDVQMIGGMVINDGKIAEMRTGEGKTLMSTLPCYLNALTEKGVHLVTVNDYLAKRDGEWMEPVFNFLGMTVGTIHSGQASADKQAAYNADVTYGTNNEFGFDYLRNNLAFGADDRLQRGLHFAVIDEVDSILIDEARTPLIISGPSENTTDLYEKINKLIPSLTPQLEEDGPGDYAADEKTKQVNLTEEGHEKIEELMQRVGLIPEGDSLYSSGNIILMHHLNAAMRAHKMYQKDVDYIVNAGEVVIVDEFTGRTMPGRRWSDGLHQAIEAKEGLDIQSENQTLASITFQNYFRMYEKLSGMTGTADTEAFEFQQIYGLEVAVIPTNEPMIRKDRPDLVYRTIEDKFNGIADAIKEDHARGRPVLVGTTSIETSELLSGLLKKHDVAHNVLNAKQHEREADIVANAGHLGAVTIATNMAGRGTDIKLGDFDYADLVRHWQAKGLAPQSLSATVSDPKPQMVEHLLKKYFYDEAYAKHKDKSVDEKYKVLQKYWKEYAIEPIPMTPVTNVVELGGLHILGTERHESRRIDNQLRGRAGRQGDPGSSRFYISLEDNLMRIFGDVSRMDAIMGRLLGDGEAIESGMLSKQIEKAQRKVEGHNFDIRKNLLEYDDVANDQRKVIYEQRNDLMDTDDISEIIEDMREEVIDGLVADYISPQMAESQWDAEGLEQALQREYGVEYPVKQWLTEDQNLTAEGVTDKITETLVKDYQDKENQIGSPTLRHFEKAVMLQQLDLHWKEHLAGMDYLRQSVRFAGNAQKKPEHEYKREGFIMFNDMLDNIRQDTIGIVSRVRVRDEDEVEAMERQRQAEAEAVQRQYKHDESSSFSGNAAGEGAAAPLPKPETFVREGAKIGRNSPCPCGSGKKYKQCHGKLS